MKEISDKNLINLIKEKFPKFIPYWEDYVSECEGEDLGISNDVRPFTRYVTAEIKSENFNEIKKKFDFVEFLMCNGDQSVQNAIATCFL